MRATRGSYEDGTNTVPREAVSGDLPGVAMQGLNRQAILVERDIACLPEPFIAEEADFSKEGCDRAILSSRPPTAGFTARRSRPRRPSAIET